MAQCQNTIVTEWEELERHGCAKTKQAGTIKLQNVYWVFAQLMQANMTEGHLIWHDHTFNNCMVLDTVVE